jgi:hypothetical protein
MPLSYDHFWEKLSLHYPVSHGELRLPIATQLVDLSFDIPSFLTELESILQDMLEKGNLEQSKIRASQNGDSHFIPLLSEEFTGVVRFDCMLNQDGNPRVIEINADYPDGLLMHDHTYSLLSGEQIRTHHNEYLSLFDKSDAIFILIPENSFFRDAYLTEYNLLKDLGYTVFIGDFWDLVFQEWQCFVQGVAINIIRRCIESWKFSTTMVQKLAQISVKYINTFDLRTLGYKSLLGEIESPLFPKSLELSFVRTQDQLLREISSTQSNWVLKPSNLFEGKWVIIGRDVMPSEWKSLLSSWNLPNYIVQEFVDSPQRTIEFYDEWIVTSREVYFDFCPHFFIKSGKVTGSGLILSRFSKDRILNVAKGGGIWYIQMS